MDKKYISIIEASKIFGLVGVNPIIKWINEGKIASKLRPVSAFDVNDEIIFTQSFQDLMESPDEEVAKYLAFVKEMESVSDFDR